jgi:hypothetical protein
LTANFTANSQSRGFWANAGAVISSGPTYDADAQAYFTAVEAVGTLTLTEKNAWNTFVLAAKAGTNYWGSFAVINPVLGSTAATHSLNAKNPATFQATYTGTVTHTSQHMVSNGTTGYANTNFNPATHDVDALMTIAVWIRNTPADGVHVAIGAISATNRYTQIYPRLGNTFYGQVNTNNVITENTGNSTGGMFNATRLTLSAEYVQKDATRLDIGTTANAITNNNLYVMAQNSNGSAANFGTHQIAMYAIATTPLSTAQAAQFYTDFSTFITAVSR